MGLAVSSPAALEETIPYALDAEFDMLLLDASGGLETPWAELGATPDLTILRDAIRILRRIGREEEIDLVYFRRHPFPGRTPPKAIALGSVAVVLGVPAGLAAGGAITDGLGMEFAPDHSEEERGNAIVSILKASAGEASMMARCTGKTNLHNLEPEDLRALTLATSEATDIRLAGTH